ncbi:MAG TPA: DUF4147 domain-containing protein [Gemmatimonadaceae bacterium]
MADAGRRGRLEALFRAAVAGADPHRFTTQALRRRLADLDGARRLWLVALGKCAAPMSAAALAALERDGRAPSGGVIVAPSPIPSPHPALEVRVGDHPVPGEGSLAAARALGALAERVGADDAVVLLLSGGASSLAAAPVSGIAPEDQRALFALLLGSGLDIARTNVVRRRVARWGAGRLAAALAPARVLPIVVSDVPGDDAAVIGSGPCTPDPTRAADVVRLLAAAGLEARVPAGVRSYLLAAVRGEISETPKPGDAAFAAVLAAELLPHGVALDGAAAAARALGMAALVRREPLEGEAAERGVRLAAELLLMSRELALVPGAARTPLAVVWGGETTVTLPDAGGGAGGRCQELALAAAGALARDARARPVALALLAAGTDGRDGPTDAAGAVVDATTWDRVREAGRDPELDLSRHDSYRALDAAGALLRTGATGTNVMDVVIALLDAPAAR